MDDLWPSIILHLQNVSLAYKPFSHYSSQKRERTTFSHSLLFKMQSEKWASKTTRKQFLWNYLKNLSSSSERPRFETILDPCHCCSFQHSNHGSHLPVLPNVLNCKKTPMANSTFNILTVSTAFTNNSTQLSEAILLINLLVTGYYPFTFIYSHLKRTK